MADTPTSPTPTPDAVADILRAATATDSVRADAWDTFHRATSLDELATQLTPLALPDAVKADLWDLKQHEVTPDFRVEIKASDSPSLLDRGLGVIKDLASGARAGVASTVYHGGDLIRRVTGMDRIIDEPDVKAAMTPPDSLAGKVGYYGEQGAEFAVPVAKVAGAAKGLPLVARMGAEALASAGVAGVQSGGDPSTMGTAAAMGAAAPATGLALRVAGRVMQRAAAGAEEGGVGGAIAAAVRNIAPAEPRTLLIQALKPRSTRVNFVGAADRAMPELKAAEAAIGKPITDMDSLLEAAQTAKGKIQAQLNQLRGAQQAIGAEVDLSSVADAMDRSIPKKLRLQNPDAAAALEAQASTYRARFSLQDAETLLRETNAELDGFYSMYPQAQRRALTANPNVAALEAQASRLRDVIYAKLDAPGQGAAARELNRRYGALMEVENETYRRLNVARRQQPESLSEQIGAVRAAADMARGTWRVLHGDLTGAADIAASRAGRAAATAIKEGQTTDALIRRAFANFGQLPTPVEMPAPPRIRGLLPSGPIITPPPADTSAVRGVKPVSIVVRDPNTGQFKRVYLSEPK